MNYSKIPALLFDSQRPRVIFTKTYEVYNGQRHIKVGLLQDSNLPEGSHFVLLTFTPNRNGEFNNPHSHLYLRLYKFIEGDVMIRDYRILQAACVFVYDVYPNWKLWEHGKGFWIFKRVYFETNSKPNLTIGRDRYIVGFVHGLTQQAIDLIEKCKTEVGGFWENEIRPGPFNEKPARPQW